MTRVTQTSLHRLALSAVFGRRSDLQSAQQVALSGLRVARPSDDPAAAARAKVVDSILAGATGHRSNIAHGTARLQAAEQSLSEIGNILTRVKQLALAMANETNSATERDAAALEVEQLRRASIDLINTKHGTEYVFAHVDTLSPPVDQAGAFTYDVNTYDRVRQVEIGPSQTAEIGASGSHAFAARAAQPGSVDILAVMDGLVTDLRANDSAGIRSRIDSLETAFDQVLSERARTGVRQQRLEVADTAALQQMGLLETLRADLVDADAAEAFSNLQLAETGMQAAIAVTARILGPSLLDAF